jgi:transcriptional regulator with XRE-family HTH domain
MLECAAHRKYKGKRAPRTTCAGCWAVYLGAMLDGPDMHPVRLATMLKLELKKRKITLTELARLSRQTIAGISRMVSGKGGASPLSAERLAEIMGLYGDDRLIFIYDATRRFKRKKNIAFDVTSDVGQAVIRKVLREHRECLEREK